MNQTTLTRPPATEYAPAFERYLARVPEADVLAVLAGQARELPGTLGSVRGEGERFRYAEGKWSIREVLGHMIDAERIFGYRAVSIARGEKASLPGFDENAYVEAGSFDDYPLPELLAEFSLVREGHLALFRHLRPEAWLRIGSANGHPHSVRAMAFVMAGHVRHHLSVLTERYLPHVPGRS
jgi:hypothetical protein